MYKTKSLKKHRNYLALALALVSVSSISSQTASAQVLIPFANPTALPTAVNDSGVVVGEASSGDLETDQYPFAYSNGVITNLGNVGGPNAPIGTAVGISDSGVAVGNNSDIYGNATVPFTYANGKIALFGTPGAIASIGATDAAGDITGVESNETTAFVDKDGSFTNLTAPGLAVSPAAVNSSGNVAGSYTTGTVTQPDSLSTAFFYSGGKLTSLPSLGGAGTISLATGINDANEVVGRGSLPKLNATHAFSYKNGVTTDLGTLIGNLRYASSAALGINNAGDIIGYSTATYLSTSTAAFIYSPTTGMENLNTLYASFLVAGGTGSPLGFVDLSEATAINNLGDITGIGDYWDGTRVRGAGFLLEPAAVPEPGSWVMGALALLSFWQLRRARV